jgi:hypothetical protein
MKFMILLKADKNTEAGVLFAAEGLQPSSKGARVKFSGGKRTMNQRAVLRNEGTDRWLPG